MIPWHWAVVSLLVIGALLAAFYFVFIYRDRSSSFVPDPTAPIGCMATLVLGLLGVAITLAIAGWLR